MVKKDLANTCNVGVIIVTNYFLSKALFYNVGHVIETADRQQSRNQVLIENWNSRKFMYRSVF